MANKTTSVEVSPDPSAGITTLPKGVKPRLADVETLTKAVLWVGLVAVGAAIITASALVLDQMHFNNQTYREQSRINEARFQNLDLQNDVLEKQNEALQKQIDALKTP